MGLDSPFRLHIYINYPQGKPIISLKNYGKALNAHLYQKTIHFLDVPCLRITGECLVGKLVADVGPFCINRTYDCVPPFCGSISDCGKAL